jgi:hypothetical protein
MRGGVHDFFLSQPEDIIYFELLCVVQIVAQLVQHLPNGGYARPISASPSSPAHILCGGKILVEPFQPQSLQAFCTLQQPVHVVLLTRVGR